MPNFNESKLSKILARRLIVPEDRSQLLPFSTPIYCPTYNGVRASKVTVINPNTNSFFNDSTLPDTTSIGVTQSKIEAALNPLVEKNGTLSINDLGIATGFSSTNYVSIEAVTSLGLTSIHTSGFIPAKFTQPINIASVTSTGLLESITVQPNGNITLTRGATEVSTIGKAKLGTEYHLDLKINTNQVNVTIRSLSEDGSNLIETFLPNENISLVTFGASSDASFTMDLKHAYFNIDEDTRVPFFNNGRQVSSIRNVKNTFDINLTIPVRRTYSIPHEVSLETDVNLMEMIKSDFGVVFKKAISNEILNQIIANKDNITKLNMGATTAETMGLVIADNILNGTGQKYSIYKYNNGAPVTYTKSSNQPNYDELVLKSENSDVQYVSKDDVAIPAMYYVEQPTLILDSTKFTEFQKDLCSGTTRTYVNSMINVDSTKVDISGVGQGIFGTNDTFAVAFTEPKVTRVHDKDFFADNLCIEIYFGVTLVHTDNIRFFT